MTLLVRHDPPGWIDEIIAIQTDVHLEDMGDFFWMDVEDRHFHLYSTVLPWRWWWGELRTALYSRTWPNFHRVRIEQIVFGSSRSSHDPPP